jgi:hypothetical protein
VQVRGTFSPFTVRTPVRFCPSRCGYPSDRPSRRQNAATRARAVAAGEGPPARQGAGRRHRWDGRELRGGRERSRRRLAAARPLPGAVSTAALGGVGAPLRPGRAPVGCAQRPGAQGRRAVGCVGGGATRIAVTRGRDATMAALPSLAQNGCLLQPVRGQSSLFVHREGHFFSMAAPRARTTPILCTLELAMRT